MIWETVGLTEEEYQLVVQELGRQPNELELEMIGVMWSEHCSYKSSRIHLRRLPTDGPQVLQGPGENAGVVDLGNNVALALRCESHNHPTAINPYHGAATGVGGILRDIFTMGARPAAVLSSLRIGSTPCSRNRYLLQEAVAGIRDFARYTGVPAVGGELYFSDCYTDNPLVNVMGLGFLAKDRIVRGRAQGVGNPVYVIGAPTGRHGVRSASHASRELQQDDEGQPPIQVGDPQLAHRLMEACLELVAAGVVVGMNDLGAAGLTSACSETANRAGHGMEIYVDNVPLAESGLSPMEIMLSETQERMLIIAQAGSDDAVRQVAAKWNIEVALIGRVTDDHMLRVRQGNQTLAELPVQLLTEAVPAYDRPQDEPADLQQRWIIPAAVIPEHSDARAWTGLLTKLLADPDICSRRKLQEQLGSSDNELADHSVAGATIIPIPGSSRAVVACMDGNGRYAYLDPYRGAALAVAEAARNIACRGARPLALTNCLNMASPERPEVMWQFSRIIDGMSAAAAALNTPVTGGNVSFYNETATSSIYPTPVIGMVGVLADVKKALEPGWQDPGDAIVLLGPEVGYLEGSRLLQVVSGLTAGRPPMPDLELERNLIELLLAAYERGLLKSAHDLADGGLAVALAEACFAAASAAARGAQVRLNPDSVSEPAAALFGEAPSRVLVSLKERDVEPLLNMASAYKVPATVIGFTGGGRLHISIADHLLIDAGIDDLYTAWSNGLKEWLSTNG